MTAPRASVEEAMESLHRFMRQRRRSLVGSWQAHRLTVAQLQVLGALSESGPVTIGQLAEVLGTSPPSVSTITDRMEEAGLVRRERDCADRRVVRVLITEAGGCAFDEVMGMKDEMLRRVLSQVGDDDLRELVRIVGVLEEATVRAQALADTAAGS